MNTGIGFQNINDIAPWGRSFDEYVQIFELTPEDLKLRILDCGGGPASFAAEATEHGYSAVACDPIYRFRAEDIARRVHEVYPAMLAGMESERDRFVWTHMGSPEQVGQRRLEAMRRFLNDFPAGLGSGRYVAEGLPLLSFADDSFGLALSSHFLFLYSEQLSAEFHCAAVEEMLRVAQEARIFPLMALDGEFSPHLGYVMDELSRRGHTPELIKIDFEFQKGGNQLMRVCRGGTTSLASAQGTAPGTITCGVCSSRRRL